MTTVDHVRPPLYAQTLRLRHTQPGAVACCVLFEGSLLMGGLLALSELAGSWALPGMPITVAALVKLTDAAFGALATGPALVSTRGPAVAGALYRRKSGDSFEVERVSDTRLQPGHMRQLDYAQQRRSGVWESSTCPRGNARPARMEVCEEAAGARSVPNQGYFEA